MQSEHLPGSPDTDQTANLAMTFTQAVFEKHGWIFRRQDGVSDFGIDAEIEIREKNLVTGRIFKGQVKGRQNVRWQNGVSSVSVSVSTYNLWKSMPVPLIAFLCDVGRSEVYWTLPISQVPREGAKSMLLIFDVARRLVSSFDILEKLLQTWFTAFENNILREVPLFHRTYRRLRDQFGGDPWVMLPVDVDAECRLFYHHLIELCLKLGLKCDHLPTIDEWYFRSTATWGDDRALFWGTFEELMDYVKPDYEEALQELRRRSQNVKPCFENQELLAFLDEISGDGDGKVITTYIYMDPRMHSREFAQDFDEKLRKRSALKFSQPERPR